MKRLLIKVLLKQLVNEDGIGTFLQHMLKSSCSSSSTRESTVPKQTSPETFIADAEKAAKKMLAGRDSIGIWRVSRGPRLVRRSSADKVVIGLFDPDAPSEPSALVFLEASVDQGMAAIKYDTPGHGGEGSGSTLCPFGGGHNPLSRWQDYIANLATYEI